jgi:hypothetical protein
VLRSQTIVAATFIVIPLIVLSPDIANAQGGSEGSIIGYVYDQTGAPIKGVKVTATSPTQIGGAKTAYTNDEGTFRMRQLFPGTFELRATAPRLKTVIQKEVRVGISAAAEVNLIMEVETGGVEEIRVVEKAPTVSTTTANVKEVYDLDFVEALPFNGRDQVFNQMVSQIGGAVGTRIRGGGASQTIMTQDGFDMRDQYPVTKASAAYEIQSAGYGADNATASGGLVNLVSKTGSNKWEFDFNATYEDDWTRVGKDARDGRGNFYYVLNPAVAGPIVKDKLWFAFTAETHLLGNSRDPDVDGILPTPRPHVKGINKGTFKLTWQATARNKLTLLSNFDSAWNINMRNDLGVEQEAQQNRRAGLSGLWGLIWETLLTDDLIFRSQAAYSKRPQHIYPWLCENGDEIECQHIPGIIYRTTTRSVSARNVARGCNGTGACSGGSSVPHRRQNLEIYQANNQLQYFLDSKVLGEHSFVLKDQFYTETETEMQEQPGDYYEEYLNGNPEARTTFYSNDPRHEPARYGWWIAVNNLYRNVATLSDSWRPTRYLTITPAITHAWAKGTNGAGDTVIDNNTWAPSVATAWDATHDGRTVIRGSYSQYVDVAIRTPTRHTLGSQTSQRCLWNSDTKAYDRNCTYSGGLTRNTFGSPCGPSGIDEQGNDCTEKLEIPRTHEITFGGEREIVQGIGLGVDLIYRRFNNQYEQRETNRIWDPAGETVIGYRDGRNQTVTDMGTPDGASRTYQGITASLNKRAGILKTYVSYTLSQLRGNVFDDSTNPWGDIPGRDPYLFGPGADDHRHDIKLSLQWSATKWLSMGMRYNFVSGFPYDRLFRNDVTGSYENYRARTGTNPGSNINDPNDDRELRMPNRQDVNVQVRLSMLPLIGQRLDFYVDALNILNLRTPTGFGQNSGMNFGNETSWMAPFRMRFGMNYRF